MKSMNIASMAVDDTDPAEAMTLNGSAEAADQGMIKLSDLG